MESSIQIMEQFLAEDKYQMAGFDLEYTIGRVGLEGCSRQVVRAT